MKLEHLFIAFIYALVQSILVVGNFIDIALYLPLQQRPLNSENTYIEKSPIVNKIQMIYISLFFSRNMFYLMIEIYQEQTSKA